jgi:hypothetical protein
MLDLAGRVGSRRVTDRLEAARAALAKGHHDL